MSQDSLLTPELKRVPNYEQHGEAMVAEGVYPEVIRYHQHLVPLFVALRQSELVTGLILWRVGGIRCEDPDHQRSPGKANWHRDVCLRIGD